jgi:hypothetical protein
MSNVRKILHDYLEAWSCWVGNTRRPILWHCLSNDTQSKAYPSTSVPVWCPDTLTMVLGILHYIFIIPGIVYYQEYFQKKNTLRRIQCSCVTVTLYVCSNKNTALPRRPQCQEYCMKYQETKKYCGAKNTAVPRILYVVARILWCPKKTTVPGILYVIR